MRGAIEYQETKVCFPNPEARLPIRTRYGDNKSPAYTNNWKGLDLDQVRQSVSTATVAIMDGAGLRKTAEVKKLRTK